MTLTPYEKIKQRAEGILGRTLDEFTFNELFQVLNSYQTRVETKDMFHTIAPDGSIYFMHKLPLWDISETTADDTDLVMTDKPQIDNDGNELIRVAGGYVNETQLKLDPTKPLSEQDELGNATLEALYTILSNI